jgi:dihydroorotate dehydrogenase electron transfer subunit
VNAAAAAVSVAPACAARRTVTVLENVEIARETYRLRLDDPVMAAAIRPGQFLMIRPTAVRGRSPAGAQTQAQATDPLLGRPFALYDVGRDAAGRPTALDVVYLVVGRGTAALAACAAGDRLSVWGPLGNGFGPPPDGPVVFVAGGIGQTPFLALGRWWLGQAAYGHGGDAVQSPAGGPGPQARARARSATLLYGVRTAALAAGVEDFRAAGIAVELATDDGSAGHHGFVTELLARRLERGDGERPARVVGCGPPAMLAALGRLVARHGVACDLSLENHMACGFGACFSCVAPIRQADGTLDLRRVCVEGPIFPAGAVEWPSAGR